LINPECIINPYFTKITGITNEMVADAPRFHEVAAKILEMTEGCVFVAHNVSFDYGFIRDEFHSLGYSFKRDTLCTVRLSRKLIPGKISYSLGHLCAALGIEIFGRHRAEGDAVATVQLFELLLRLKADHPVHKNQGVDDLMIRRVDKIKEYILSKLPESCGVYYFLNEDRKIIYIGKSTNMYSRARSHFQTDIKKNKKMLFELMNVDYVQTGSELIALLLESEEIKKHKPLYNRMRKADEFIALADQVLGPGRPAPDAAALVALKGPLLDMDASLRSLRRLSGRAGAQSAEAQRGRALELLLNGGSGVPAAADAASVPSAVSLTFNVLMASDSASFTW
jgi:DNA polymerase-3 subunit epsilon